VKIALHTWVKINYICKVGDKSEKSVSKKFLNFPYLCPALPQSTFSRHVEIFLQNNENTDFFFFFKKDRFISTSILAMNLLLPSFAIYGFKLGTCLGTYAHIN
jgi:hypothetical protein